jgi:ribosomal protein S18 acetylase RimI-like enzyme
VKNLLARWKTRLYRWGRAPHTPLDHTEGPTITIRKAAPKDNEAITQIWLDNLTSEPYSLAATRQTASEAVRRGIMAYDTRVACIQGVIVGFTMASVYRHINGRHLWVTELHVASNYQRRGIGRALLERLETDYRKADILSIELLSHQEASAFEFYQHLGFEATPCRKMQKRLR